ncbi:MAG: hypothetical protein WCO82_08275 [Sphingomonadales bacterium]|jgi:tetratricopeptide (TPR) repeat protein
MPIARSLLATATLTLAASALAFATPAAAAVSSTVGKALQAAAKAAGSGNTGAAIAEINKAKAAASSAEEKQKTAEMAGYVYTRAGKFAEAAAELEAAGRPAGQLAPLYYRAGQYDKAIALAKQAGGEQNQILIAQAYLRQGKSGQAVAAYQALIKSNGAKPAYLENLAGAQYKSGDKKGYLATTTRLIKVDASPARWKTLLTNFQQNNMRAEAKLAMFHLMSQTGALTRPEDFTEFAKLALINGEAKVAQDALAKAGGGSDVMSKKLSAAAAAGVTKEAAEAAKLSASPTTAFKGGTAWAGVGDYAKAMAAYDVVIKGNPAEAGKAMVFKGIAAVKAGNTAVARASFAGTPEASGMKDIADLWVLYLSSRG